MPTLVLVGNHVVLTDGQIVFDQISIDFGTKKFASSDQYILGVFIDNIDSPVASFLQTNPKKGSFIKNKSLLKDTIAEQLEKFELVIFESSLKQKVKNTKNCSLLPPNAFRKTDESKSCSCWGLLTFLLLKLKELYGEVIFITSTSSTQLKVADVIKAQQFLSEDKNIQIVWA